MKTIGSSERDTTCRQMIQTVRRVLNLTRVALAEQLGVSQQTLRNWEAGKRTPRPEHLKQVIELALWVLSIKKEGLWITLQRQEP